MKKIVTLLFILQLVFISTNGQTANWQWAKSMGGSSNEGGKSVAVDNSGNVYVTGYFQLTVDFDPSAATANLTSSAYDDIFITKFDRAGNFLWAKRIGGAGDDDGVAIAVDPNGDIIITGFFDGMVDFDPDSLGIYNLINTPGNVDAFILKLDANGNFIWAGNIGGGGGGWPSSLKTDNVGNIYIAGFFLGTYDFDPDAGASFNLTSTTGSSDIYLLKLNNQGVFQWVKSFGGSLADNASAIVIDANQNCYVTGYFDGTADFNPDLNLSDSITANGGKDIFIVKVDSNGNLIYASGIGGATDEWAYSLATDLQNNLYITGYFTGTVDFDPNLINTVYLTSAGLQDIFILKLDSLGNYLWAKNIGGAGYDYGNSIVFDTIANGSVLLTGSFSGTVDFDPSAAIHSVTSAGTQNSFLLKLDVAGNFQWAQGVGGAMDDEETSIALDGIGNIFTTGYFNSSSISFGSNALANFTNGGGQEDIYLAKFGVCSSHFSVFPDTIPQHWFAVNEAYGSSQLAYTWYWGDGDSSVAQFPDHVYSSAGLYTICLTVNDSMGCADSYCDTTNIFRVNQSSSVISMTVIPQIITSIVNVEQGKMNAIIYPNPTTDEFTIQLSEQNKQAELIVTDLLGEIVVRSTIHGRIRMSAKELNLRSGIYLLTVSTIGSIQNFKLVVGGN